MNATYLLSLLPLLACPLGMGLVMWLMMRGHKDQSGAAMPKPMDHAALPPAAPTVDAPDRLTALRAQLQQVEAQQAALAGHLAQLGAPE